MHIVLACDTNPSYAFYAPLTIKVWEALGHEPLLVEYTPGRYPSAWEAKVSRLYAPLTLGPTDEFVFADIDMWPMRVDWLEWRDAAAFWHWGANLHPAKRVMNYFGGQACAWKDLYRWTVRYTETDAESHIAYLCGLQRVINENPPVFSDETILTYLVRNGPGYAIQNFSRGVGSDGIPVDRIDRSRWDKPVHNPWDAHLPHDGWNHIPRLLELFEQVCPDEVEWARAWMEGFGA